MNIKVKEGLVVYTGHIITRLFYWQEFESSFEIVSSHEKTLFILFCKYCCFGKLKFPIVSLI